MDHGLWIGQDAPRPAGSSPCCGTGSEQARERAGAARDGRSGNESGHQEEHRLDIG